MSSHYRPLRPLSSLERQEQAQAQPSGQSQPTRRKMPLAAACNRCREKKMRCPGQRPSCEQCQLKEVECIYETLPGETRFASLKSKNERIENDLNIMMELYWYLQSRPKEDVAKAVAAIKTGAEPGAVMEFLSSGESSHDTLRSEVTSTGDAQKESAPTWDQHPDNSGDARLTRGEVSETDVVTETQSPRMDSANAQWPIAQAILQPSNLIRALSSGVEAFFTCTGCIFYIYDRSEAQEFLSAVRPCIIDAGVNWPQIIFRDSAPLQLKSSLCAVCIMAAIGLQYTKDIIPALDFEPSRENGTYRYVEIFYEIAKHLIDASVEHNVLEAMKVCAAMCVFNAIGHATIALAHADMGINFAVNLGPSLHSSPAGLNGVTWTDYKRVTRTLVTLRNWMITTLGYVPSENPSLRAAQTHWLTDPNGLARNEIIQQELSKVVQLEANLLRTFDSFGDISPPVFSSIRRDLAQWYEKLPQWMHLNALAESTSIERGIRRTVYLVHLFYLSASILVARLAHGGKNLSPPDYDSEESRIAASDGILAARTASRILQLQLDEQTIFQRCWLCEFTSYMSCLMLLHSTAQLALHGFPRSALEQDLSYAKSCLDVLEYCGKVDKVARLFDETIRGYFNRLNVYTKVDKDTSPINMPENFDYLFSNSNVPDAHLQNAAEDLLKLVRYPFGKPSNFHMEGTLKAGLGSQLDWDAFITLPFNRSTSDDGNSVPLLDGIIRPAISLFWFDTTTWMGFATKHR